MRPILTSIQLKNFKCHDNFEESLKPLTILAGGNAVGKSSLIQALLLYKQAEYGLDEVFTLDVYGINLGKAESVITEESGSDSTEITVSYNNGKKNGISLSVIPDNDVCLKVSPLQGDNNTGRQVHRLMYINAERIGPRVYNEIKATNNTLFTGFHGENTIYVISQIDKLSRTTAFKEKYHYNNILPFSNGESDRFSAICENCLQTIIPGVTLKSTSDAEQGISTIRYSNSGAHDVIPTATGFGITYVLPIIVQSLVAAIDYMDTVLIIENPEAHLHPYSQSMLGRFLARIASLGVQVIVETHSEHFVNGCRIELAKINKTSQGQIIFFDRNQADQGSNHTIITIDETGELSSWPQGFFDQNEQDLLEIMRNKICRK
ncbi:MAG: DUF3696 domain-containing protein [Oscillospiraceae bacterium]|nr:DUF3696 domain-containing protein [Oscillospiraceae bacterium]